VGVDDVVADVSVARAMSSVTLKGSAALRRAVADQPLAGARYELDLVNDGGTYAVRQVVLDLSDVVVRRAEHVLGRERGALWNWLGSRGNAHVSMDTVGDGFTAAIRADFENLRGEFTAVARGDMLTVSDGTANLTLSREAIQERVGRPAGSAPPGSPARPASPGGVTVVADVPVVLQVRALRLPRSILSGKPVDPAAASIDLGLTGGPLLLDATQGRSTIDDLDISLRGDDLDTGLELSISGDVSAAGGGKPGALSISGQVTNLVADDGTFAPRQAELRMTAEARGLPTAVVDAVLGWEGLLTSAIGSPIDLDATAKRFSRTTGDLEVRFETPTGWLEAFALGRDDALRILGKSPLSAELELTPPLCRQVLYKIHPLLADIRTTKHPMRASMRGAVIPLDGDVSRLQAKKVNILIGPVEFDSGSITLALLKAFNASNTETVPGEIEPITATIKDGVVTYEQFAVKIEQYALVFSGTVDLNTRTFDIRWEIPLDGLAVSISELRGKVEGIVVPMRTYGSFGDEKTDFHEDFKLEEVLLEAGVRTIFDELFKNINR
jgi:hypothetical protein